MFAVRLTSLGSRIVSPGLCNQVQRVALTGRGEEALLARQVSKFSLNLEKRYYSVKSVYIFFFVQDCITSLGEDLMTVVYQAVDVQGGCAGQIYADFDDAL